MRTFLWLLVACVVHSMTAFADEPQTAAGEEPVREITERSFEAILKRVNFDREFLLQFEWSGSGQDQIKVEVETGKAGPVAIFMLKPGRTRDLRRHFRLYAVKKNATWRVDEASKQLGDPAKFTTAEELSRQFANAKER